MTKLESRIYLQLLAHGQSKASDLARTLDVNRIDVYRSLRNMRQRGIIELIFSRPLVFATVEPRALMETLLSEQEQKSKAFKSETEKIQTQLERIPRIRSTAQTDSLLRTVSSEQFTIKTGKQITTKWKDMAQNAESEILVILSRIGLMTHSTEGFSEIYSKAKKRGVNVRIITDVVHENFSQAQEFSTVCRIKASGSVNDALRYVIADSKEVMISMGTFSNDQRGFAAIWTTRPLMIKAFRLDFQDKWRRAKAFTPELRNQF